MADLRFDVFAYELKRAKEGEKGAARDVLHSLATAAAAGQLSDSQRAFIADWTHQLSKLDHTEAARVIGFPYQGAPVDRLQFEEVVRAVDHELDLQRGAGQRRSLVKAAKALEARYDELEKQRRAAERREQRPFERFYKPVKWRRIKEIYEEEQRARAAYRDSLDELAE